MGLLVNGDWHDDWYDTEASAGRFERTDSSFRDRVTADGDFAAAPGRYHLYIAWACPWAHRTAIVRRLKGLEDVISLSAVAPEISDQGWRFDADGETGPDPILGAHHLHQVYTRAEPDFTGRVTVPVLWDKERETIVNNESADIIRMLNGAFDAWGDAAVDLYPEALREEIDAVNARLYETVNNGVYRCGFATTQAAYEDAFAALFDTLDWLEDRLSRQRHLVGDRITEADWRLFPTLVRFDAAYYGLFKCNRRRLRDYPHLWAYTCALHAVSGIADTVNLDHIKRTYYSIRQVNPTGIVPVGPDIAFTAARAPGTGDTAKGSPS